MSLAVVLVVASPPRASAQFLDWAKQAGDASGLGGISVEGAEAVAADAAGFSYVTGTFRGQATFGVGEPNETVLTGVAGQDIFVAKYDPAGALVWARGAGADGGAQDWAFGIAVDAAGNSYVTGWLNLFASLGDFGGGVTLTDPGPFVVKYDSGGTAQWATTLTVGEAPVYAIAVDTMGNAFAAGAATDPVTGRDQQVTLWKVSSPGGVQWSRQATGLYAGWGYGVAVDAGGNAFITGAFQGGSATFGPGEATETTLTALADGFTKLFVAKYSAAGDFQWARQSADVASAIGRGTGIAADAAGNSYISGIGTTVLGSGEPNETAVAGAFAARYDSSGHVVWAQSVAPPGGGINPWAFGVAHSPTGATYLTATGTACSCLFMEKYNGAGTRIWSRPLAVLTSGLELRGTVAVDAGRRHCGG
ncbi:MAG: SBBP repeat-containing protein [Vicinamibacterales bacterium]